MNNQIALHNEKLNPIDTVIKQLGSGNSQRSYRQAFASYQNFCDEAGVSGLSRGLVIRWMEWMDKQGMAPATLNTRLSAMKSLAQEASFSDIITQQEVAAIKAVKSRKSSNTSAGTWLTESEMRLVFSETNDSPSGMRNRVILALGMVCCLLVSEIEKIEFSDIRELGETAVITLTGKGNKTRDIELPMWVREIINKWQSVAGILEGRIVRSIRKGGNVGEKMSSVSIWKVVKKLSSGIKEISPHDMRRTGARLMYEQGVPISKVRDVLGHSSVTITERYIGVSVDVSGTTTEIPNLMEAL